MNERLYARDEAFDYLGGELPPALDAALGDQTQRARHLLAGRSAAELDYAFDSLDWLLREGHRRFEADFFSGKFGDVAYVNRVKVLRGLQPYFDLVGQDALPNASWPEYFAVLALACLGEQLFALAHEEPIPPAYAGVVTEIEVATQRERYLGEAAMEAMEAVCHGEWLITEAALQAKLERASGEAAEAMRAAGQRGARIRVAKYDHLRTRLLCHYDEHLSRRSNRGAAKQLYAQFQAAIDEVLHTDDPVQQIAKWIGQHKRSKEAQTTP